MPRRTLLPVLLLALFCGCSRAPEVEARASDVRQAAASLPGRLTPRQACDAAGGSLVTLGDLATRLAEHPELRVQMAPQLAAAAARLRTAVGGRPELHVVVDAGGDLATAARESNTATVRVAARQAVLAVRGAQAACSYAR